MYSIYLNSIMMTKILNSYIPCLLSPRVYYTLMKVTKLWRLTHCAQTKKFETQKFSALVHTMHPW